MRRQGTGTIEKRRGRYLARLPDAKRTSIGAFDTRDEAERELNAAVWMVVNSSTSVGRTVFDYGLHVIDRRERDGYRGTRVERQRWRTYVREWDAGSWPPSAVQRMHVQALVRTLRARKLSTSTIANVVALVRAVMRAAIDEGLATDNPCTEVRVRDHGRTEETMRPLSLEQLAALFWSATSEGRHLIAFAAGAGLRQGELRALQRADVHVDTCTCPAHLRSSQPHVVVRFSAPGKPTKSGKVRRVPLFGLARAAVRSWSWPANERGLAFPTKRGCVRPLGRVVKPEDWSAWLERAGIDRRVRWHDLRHTCATLLLTGAWGRRWSTEEVRDLLGHSTVRVTERYVRTDGALAASAAERHQSATSATTETSDLQERAAAKLAELEGEGAWRCGSDSNRRVTDLQGRARWRERSRPALCSANSDQAATARALSGPPFAPRLQIACTLQHLHLHLACRVHAIRGSRRATARTSRARVPPPCVRCACSARA